MRTPEANDNRDKEETIIEQFLSEFYGLHELNARRISLLEDLQRAARDTSSEETAPLAEEIVASVSVTAPKRSISKGFLRYTPVEMPQIYRKMGLSEAGALLEDLVEAERGKPLQDRNPCPYYNLAYVYQLKARALQGKEGDRLFDLGLALLEQAKHALEAQHTDAGSTGWRTRESMLAVMENLEAVIYLSRGDMYACEASVRKSISCDPDLPDAYFTDAVRLIQCGDFDRSILQMHKSMQMFIARGQEVADTWFHLARAYYKKAAHAQPHTEPTSERLYNEAIACLRKALEIDKDFALAHYKLGILLMRSDCDLAAQHLSEAIRSDISLYQAVTQVICPRVCTGCSGIKIKILLMNVLAQYESDFKKYQAAGRRIA